MFRTVLVSPLSIDLDWTVVSHILIVWSFDPDARRVPSGDQATERTHSLWSSKIKAHFVVPISQTLTVLSADADARRVPS